MRAINAKIMLNSAFLLVTIFLVTFTVALEDEAAPVTNLRNYLRIRTDHPNPQQGYNVAIEWFREQTRQLNLSFHHLDLNGNDEFALWITWPGSEPHLKSVLLNSHMDVVPADPDKWIHPPFDAFKDDQGNIYARGTVDMKSATVATLESLRVLRKENFQPRRTIHVLVMPEEEKGGFRGMRGFVETPEFAALNVGVDVDEGGVNPGNEEVAVWYAEKAVWQFNISARGLSAHGSTLPEFTASQRLHVAITKLLEFREAQFRKLQEVPNMTVDQLTVLNLVQLGGGFAENVIPPEVWAVFDMRVRILPGWNFTDVEAMLEDILEQARLGNRSEAEGVDIKYIASTMEKGETVTNSTSGWWTVIDKTCDELNITCKPVVANAATDGRYLRNLDIPVFGMGLFLNTPNTMHQDNEMINELEFLDGIERYTQLIKNLASTSSSLEP